ncbi:substrate-binding periplasmic protein [Colwellia sp. MEBiC06753]
MMRFRRLLISFVCLIMVKLPLKQAVAEETDTHDELWMKDSLTVVAEPWWPFNYYDEQSEIVGRSAERVKALMAKADINFNHALYPWRRAYNMALAKPNVLIYSIYRTKARENKFNWICPLLESSTHKIYKLRSRTDIQINNERDLSAYRINVVRGTYPHDYLLKLGLKEGSSLQLSALVEQHLKLLLNKRVDLIVEAGEVINELLAQSGYPADLLEEVYTFKNTPQFCMAISKGTSPQLIEKIEQAHRELIQ